MGNHLKSKSNAGLSLIATILALLIFSLFIAVAVSLVTTGSNIGLQEEQGVQAFYIAEGGMQYTLRANTYCAYNSPSTSLGSGNFITASQLYNTTVTDNPLTPAATTINVNNTAGFIIPGIIKIDLEYIRCNNKPSSTQFTDCTRGVAGSDADQHNLGATVEQCVVTSTGTVSTGILFGNVRRVVQATVGE